MKDDYCPQHRVKVTAAGCPVCAHEDETAAAPPRWSSLVNWTLLVPLLIVGLWVGFRSSPLEAPGSSGPAAVLDPEPYRASLEAMESALYSEERLSGEQVEQLRFALGALATEMRKVRDPGRLKALDVVRFADKYRTSPESPDVGAARHQWEELRRKAFASADWFREGGAALDEAQSLAGAHGVPPDTGRYAETLEGLRIIMARADSALGGWPEDSEEIDMSTDQQWESARGNFKTDLERMRAGFPARHSNVSPAWKKAYDDLEKAARAVERILAPFLHGASMRPDAGALRSRLRLGADAVSAADASLAQAQASGTMPP